MVMKGEYNDGGGGGDDDTEVGVAIWGGIGVKLVRGGASEGAVMN